MRLIDADAMNEELFYEQMGGKDTLITCETAFDMIKEQPTAYSVENVVEELNELPTKAIDRYKGGVFGNWEGADYYINKANAIEIVKQKTEQYNNGWITCSERLPKYGEVVMCSCTNSGITISCITHKGVKPSKSVRFGQHSVIAWQPLPEPYQPKGEQQ